MPLLAGTLAGRCGMNFQICPRVALWRTTEGRTYALRRFAVDPGRLCNHGRPLDQARRHERGLPHGPRLLRRADVLRILRPSHPTGHDLRRLYAGQGLVLGGSPGSKVESRRLSAFCIGLQNSARDNLDVKLARMRNAVAFPLGNRGLRKTERVSSFLLRPKVGNELFECHGADYRKSFSICQRGSDIYFGTVPGI